MIQEIKIENYKSIETLSLSLGRVNVFIGENGCGKSNILEAIALYSASLNNKLDNEFLFSRGIRATQDPKLMRSAFKQESIDKEIKISIVAQDGMAEECILQNDNKSLYSKWMNLSQDNLRQTYIKKFKGVVDNLKGTDKLAVIKLIDSMNFTDGGSFRQLVIGKHLNLETFLIYSPENTSLRTFETENQILPLGIKGEGLFKLLKVMSVENKEELQEIKKGLELIDWFKDFHLPNNLYAGEKYIQIEDRYIDRDLKYFDQVSSNEGFLFLLFYFCLFISSQTPKFFAVDNIDASLNPKLSRELMRRLVILAKKHNKQVIFTTHSPSILDGLDLNDDEQKLFVIYRNKLGHTKALPVSKPTIVKGEEPLKLSEEFLRGYLGGLPKNF